MRSIKTQITPWRKLFMSKKPVILLGMLRVNKMDSLVIDYLKKYGFEDVDIS